MMNHLWIAVLVMASVFAVSMMYLLVDLFRDPVKRGQRPVRNVTPPSTHPDDERVIFRDTDEWDTPTEVDPDEVNDMWEEQHRW